MEPCIRNSGVVASTGAVTQAGSYIRQFPCSVITFRDEGNNSWRGYRPPGPPWLAPPARAAFLGGAAAPRTPPTGASGAPEAP
eukprot:12334897-Alexandrium_andersonii.AAC.1